VDCSAALYSFLSTNATVTAAVSTRTYPVSLPQKATLPALVYTETDPGYLHAMVTDAAERMPVFEIEAHASTAKGAADVIAAVVAAVTNYSGAMGTQTGTTLSIEFSDEGYDPDSETFYKTYEFKIFMK
jgi:hypothetical protein